MLGFHERAFAFFGGVPAGVLYDHVKTLAIKRDAYRPRDHQYQAGFLDFARHYGFRPPAVPALSGQDQGQGRAHERLSALQLLRALRHHDEAGRACARCREREPRGASMVRGRAIRSGCSPDLRRPCRRRTRRTQTARRGYIRGRAERSSEALKEAAAWLAEVADQEARRQSTRVAEQRRTTTRSRPSRRPQRLTLAKSSGSVFDRAL